MEDIKNNMIIAFKKKLSQIDDYKNIYCNESINIFIEFDDFKLYRMMDILILFYKSIEVDLKFEEWQELYDLVLKRKKELQQNNNNKDYNDLMEIINS